MFKEADKRICKVCGVLKERILVGKYNNKDKKYVDLEGSCWNGRLCPLCNRLRMQSNMQKLRTIK